MKEQFKNVAINLSLWAYKFAGRLIVKCQIKHMTAVFFKAYIQTFVFFPKRKLIYNSDLALFVKSKLFSHPPPENIRDLRKEDIDKLYDYLNSDAWIKLKLSNYYRINAFIYSFGFSTDLFKEKSEEYLIKAGTYADNVTPITSKEMDEINKNIKKELKELKREMRKLNAEKIEAEKSKLIKPIVVTSSHFLFVASLFSSLFLISGFVYSKFYFGSLGLNVSDFFSTTDYLSSSIDVIAAAIISSVIGVAVFYLVLNYDLSEDLRDEQFETERKGEDYIVPFIVVTSVIGLVTHSYNTGELLNIYLFPLMLFIVMFIIFRLPIWKYIVNRNAVTAVVISVLYFSLHLGMNIKDSLENIENENYESPYIVSYNKGYEKFTDYIFLSANSSYIFLLSKENRKVTVVPKSAIKKLQTK